MKNVEEYCESFDPQHLFSVMQFFEWFDCCQDLIAPIQQFLDSRSKELAQIKRRAQDQFERADRPLLGGEYLDFDAPCQDADRKPRKTLIIEPPRPSVVVGFCPQCSSTMVGESLPGCESENTGRHFYSECTACRYYTEIFKGRKGRYIEMKGE